MDIFSCQRLTQRRVWIQAHLSHPQWSSINLRVARMMQWYRCFMFSPSVVFVSKYIFASFSHHFRRWLYTLWFPCASAAIAVKKKPVGGRTSKTLHCCNLEQNFTSQLPNASKSNDGLQSFWPLLPFLFCLYLCESIGPIQLPFLPAIHTIPRG